MKFLGLGLAFLLFSGCVTGRDQGPAPVVEVKVGEGHLELRTEAGAVFSWDPAAGEAVLRLVNGASGAVETWKSPLSREAFRTIAAGKGRIDFGSAGALVPSGELAPRKEKDGGTVQALPLKASGQLASRFGEAEQLFRVEVRLLNLNALNYWDGNPTNTKENRLYGYDEFRPGFSNWFEPRIQEAKASTVERVLILAGLPDVVALQELEWAQGASEVFSARSPLRKKLEALGYQSFLLGKQGPENEVGITTGFVSRYPLRDAEPVVFNIRDREFDDFDEKERSSVRFSTRNIQVAELELQGRVLRLYNNHWRSKGCSDEAGCERSDRVREANARVLARGVAEARKKFPRADHVLLGDFNSEYTDESLTVAGATSDLAAVQSGRRVGGFFNPWYELPESQRWERSFAGKKTTLSHILLDATLFDADAFQYKPGSFRAVGQLGAEAQLLLNADGEPLRWQTAKLRPAEAPEADRKLIEAALAERGCTAETAQKRKCKTNYFDHSGLGYFDHLPVEATLRFTGETDSARTTFSGTQVARQGEAPPIGPCSADKGTVASFPELATLDVKDAALRKLCVRFEPAQPEMLLTRGIYDSNYVTVKGVSVGFSMFNAYDPRAIVDGKPMAQAGDKMNDGSDMCFVRKVLQRNGGKVQSAWGRMGFENGIPTLFLAKRADVKLVELPPEKEVVCGGRGG